MKKINTLIAFFLVGSLSCLLVAQTVTINSNLKIEADGTIVSENEGTTWDDITVFPDAATKGTLNPPVQANFKSNVLIWNFSGSADNSIFFSVQIPHGYKVGSTIYPHVHWTPTGTSTLNVTPGTPYYTSTVTWALEYTIAKVKGDFGAATTLTPVR